MVPYTTDFYQYNRSQINKQFGEYCSLVLFAAKQTIFVHCSSEIKNVILTFAFVGLGIETVSSCTGLATRAIITFKTVLHANYKTKHQLPGLFRLKLGELLKGNPQKLRIPMCTFPLQGEKSFEARFEMTKIYSSKSRFSYFSLFIFDQFDKSVKCRIQTKLRKHGLFFI